MVAILSGCSSGNPNIYIPPSSSASQDLPESSSQADKQEQSSIEYDESQDEQASSQQNADEANVFKKVDLDLRDSVGYLIIGDKMTQMCNIYPENVKAYTDSINRLKLQLPDKKITVMQVPNSYHFFAPKEYITEGVNQENMISDLYSQLNRDIGTVDVFSALREHKEEYIFFRTDHHWTTLGTYYGYVEYCEAVGIVPNPLPEKPSGTVTDYLGTHYEALKPYPQAQAAAQNPDYIDYYLPKVTHTAKYYSDMSMQNGISMKVVNPDFLPEQNKYLMFLEGQRPIIHINTEVKNGNSILIVKDSYINAMIPFLMDHYEDIYIVDFRNFNGESFPPFNAVEFVNQNSIDEILIENYPFVPNDKGYSSKLGRMIP